MREFLLQNGLLLAWLMAAVEVVIGMAAMRKKSMLAKLVAALSFGLAADAFIQAIGVWLGAGAELQAISQLRYLLHGILVPLMIPISLYACGKPGEMVKKAVWVITGLLMLGGIAMGVIAKTEPVMAAGVLRYAQTADTPAFARAFDRLLSIGGVIPVIAIGVWRLIRQRKVWLLLGGVVMFAFSALAPATHNMDLNFLLTMVGEMLMVGCFCMEVKRQLPTD